MSTNPTVGYNLPLNCVPVEWTNLRRLFVNMLLVALLVHAHVPSLLKAHFLCLLQQPSLFLSALLLQLTHSGGLLHFHLFRGQCSLQTCYLGVREGRKKEGGCSCSLLLQPPTYKCRKVTSTQEKSGILFLSIKVHGDMEESRGGCHQGRLMNGSHVRNRGAQIEESGVFSLAV